MAIDCIHYLEDWIERGKVPERLVCYRSKLKVSLDYYGLSAKYLEPWSIDFTRPHFPDPPCYLYSGASRETIAAALDRVGKSGLSNIAEDAVNQVKPAMAVALCWIEFTTARE